MKAEIILDPKIAVTLEAVRSAVGQLEFSGFGFAKQTEEGLFVYDFVLLNVGNETYTEIATKDIVALMDRKDAAKMKVWVHRHPMGNGKPGFHNWSSLDDDTIKTAPLGGIPELVKWSASIVFTPKGWVGRIDNHISGKTEHVPVSPKINWDTVGTARTLRIQYLNSLLDDEKEDDFDEALPEDFDFDDEYEVDLEDEEYTQEDFLLSQMHLSSLRSAGIIHERAR